MNAKFALKVSVIIPVYNTEKYLRECLDSVLNQSLRDIEIICVDDGSTDSSPQILEEYAQRDSRVKILRQQNKFAGVARNNGMKIARGKYLCFLDSDDTFAPEMLKKMVARAETADADIVCCGFRNHFEDGSRADYVTEIGSAAGGDSGVGDATTYCLRDSDLSFGTFNAVVWNKIFLREFVESTPGLTFLETSSSNDLTFVYVALAAANRIAVVPGALLTHLRFRTGSISETRHVNQGNCLQACVEIEKRIRALGFFEELRERVWAARMATLGYELGLNPTQEFLNEIYAMFPQMSPEHRSQLEKRCFGKIVSPGLSVPAYRPPRQYPRILVRLAALFIFNKAKRKRFREQHMDLNPRDGIDINAMTDAQRRELERKKSGRSVVRRLFNSIVPATRSKTENTERHILRDNEARSNRLLAELRAARKEIAAARAETEKRLAEQSEILASARESLAGTREELSATRAELASARAETEKRLSEQSEILASARESLAGTREELSATRAELASARAETEKCLSELSKKTEEARKQSADALAALRKELSDARKELDSARKEIAGARNDTNRRIAALAGTQPKLQTALTRVEGRAVAAAGAVAALVAGIRLEPTGTLPRKIQDWYFSKTGKPLNLAAPKTYCEKMQWLKAYDVTPEKTHLTDKLAVREWVAEKVGEKYVVPVLGVWNAFDEIDFGALPQQFVLKATHGSRFNIVVPDKSALDFADAKRKFDAWLTEKYEFHYGFEMHYAGIPPRIIAEPFLEFDESGAPDWQVFCFNGKPEFVLVILGGAHADDHGTRIFYDLNWKKLPFTRLRTEVPPNEIPRPENLDEMLAVAGTLCRGFRHVCVDFFRLRDGSWRFAEMTFTRASGLMEVFPPEYDRWIGDKLVLPTDADAGSAGGNA